MLYTEGNNVGTSAVQALAGLKDARTAHYEQENGSCSGLQVVPYILNLALSNYVNLKRPLASVTSTMRCNSILLMPRSRCN